MGPEAFSAAYGLPVTLEIVAPIAPIVVVPPARNRYLLLWMAQQGESYRIFPTDGSPQFATGIEVSFTFPYMMTYALHGALVNLGWSAAGILADVAVRVVIGSAYEPPRPSLETTPNGTTVTIPLGHGRRGDDNRAPPEHAPRGAADLNARCRARLNRIRGVGGA